MIDKEKSLVYRFPELAKEWHPTKNGELTPESIVAGSNKKVWWKCKSGHEWQAIVSNRTRLHSDCPYCSGRLAILGKNDLASAFPELLRDWDYEKNNKIEPTAVKFGSSQKAWWKCRSCGHEWQTSIKNRTLGGTGCPKCVKKLIGHAHSERAVTLRGSLLDNNPLLATEWHPKNNISAAEVSANSNQKVWWKCGLCGYEWAAVVSSRNSGVGCPSCAKRNKTSFPEQAVFYYVKLTYPDAINGYRNIFSNQMELDIFIPELSIGIEYDGAVWHKEIDSKRKEKAKYEICQKNNIRLIRIREDCYDTVNGIADDIIYISPHTNFFDGLTEAICKLRKYISLDVSIIDVKNDQNRIRSFYYRNIGNRSLEKQYPEIAKEWHSTKNGDITPQMVFAVSADVVWWECKKGHEWQSSIANRVKGRKCPYCSGKKVLRGFNDLATVKPYLAQEWNYDKNKNLLPENFTAGSNTKVWWKCEKGHEWEATIVSRASGTSCPYCANQKVMPGFNDLSTMSPELAAQWDYEKNYPLTPSDVLYRSPQKAWWKCEKGHSWNIGIKTRVAGNGCPVCANKKIEPGFNDLATTNPQLAEEWHPTKNGYLKSQDVSAGSSKKVWWKCRTCSYEWQAVIANRNKGAGCPMCARKRKKHE